MKQMLAALMLFPATLFAQSGWFPQQSGTTQWLWDVSFGDANTGTVVGNGGTILRTTNGGGSWTSQPSGTTNGLFGVSFTDANTGTAVGVGLTKGKTMMYLPVKAGVSVKL